ncbi:MAG: bifunctional pyr operon transcriptional regulator/uracil phosphoribosyltransferase PyrR [Proteobacteria bacterium]|nr:bifunctional pyr operon transcriptional regulator/uracil phosphoribosyltransferase PyrR [Desulfobulbaceae bacterium]MBU4151720.1 bifunctional pyr operon transcriptional regulator/uracil phosphoribosyltransferase PyrR [Pseudomonadota bacterium]
MSRQIMSAADMQRSLDRIVLQILEQNNGVDNLAVVGIHTGGVYLAERIKKIIFEREGADVPLGTLDITLYRDDWSLAAQNPMVKKTDIKFAVEDYTIILVDDVLFTGRTIRAALDAIMDFGRPRCIQLAVLIDRKCGRELPVQPNYVGLEVLETLDEHVDVTLSETEGKDDEVVLVWQSR